MIEPQPNMRFLCMTLDTEEFFTITEGRGMPQMACYLYEHHPNPAVAKRNGGRFVKYTPSNTGRPRVTEPMPIEVKGRMLMSMLLAGIHPYEDEQS